MEGPGDPPDQARSREERGEETTTSMDGRVASSSATDGGSVSTTTEAVDRSGDAGGKSSQSPGDENPTGGAEADSATLENNNEGTNETKLQKNAKQTKTDKQEKGKTGGTLKQTKDLTIEPEREKEPGRNSEKPTEIVKETSFPALFDTFVANVKSVTASHGSSLVDKADCANMQQMFSLVFNQHKQDELPDEKSHFPTLLGEEMESLLRLFWAEVLEGEATCQQWKNRLRDLTKSIYGSRRSLIDTIELRENEIKVRDATVSNPWASNPLAKTTDAEGDEPMEEISTVVRFRTDVYSSTEIEEMRAVYIEAHDFPSELREPKEIELKITQGLLEGNILAQGLPQFLKRTCDNDLYRAIQNTIYAQVEGELYFQLPLEFPVYPDFQTRERLIAAILQGAKKQGFDQNKLTKMLGDSKQVCYNSQQHSLHLFFWTREAASGWGEEFHFMPFRGRRFMLQNARPSDDTLGVTPNQRSARIWKRQIGSDGIRNEQRHSRYRVKLLNVSRFLDEAALDAFIRSKFDGNYATFQEPRYGRQIFQTGAWEVYFQSPGCPHFLDKVKFINWMGKKILVHHVGTSPASPCYNCGVPGHTVVQCRLQSDSWARGKGCITVTTDTVARLVRRKSTVTSFQELELMWKQLRQHQEKLTPPGQVGQQERLNEQPKTEVVSERDEPDIKSNSDWKTPSRSQSFRPKNIVQREINSGGIERQSENEPQVIDLAGSSDGNSEVEDIGPDPMVREHLLRPEVLEKQNRLISEYISKRGVSLEENQSKVCERAKVLGAETLTGSDVLQRCGLNPITTPATGNCQYYAIVMSLLNQGFDNDAACTSIENLTKKLKKGALMATQHGFEAEFPHDIRQSILSEHCDKASEMTAQESAKGLQERFEDVLKSSSNRYAFLSKSLWGSEVTLLMITKLRERPIFLVSTEDGSEKTVYQIFKPIHKVTSKCELQSAGEFTYRSKEAADWISILQHECKEQKPKGKLPIVLHFGSQHYTWLKFGSSPKEDSLNNFFKIKPNVGRNLGEKNGEKKSSPKIANSVDKHDERTPKPMTEEAIKEALKESNLTEDEQEEIQEILKVGGDRQQELMAFPTQGPHGLAPGLQKLLLNLDWSRPSQYELMLRATGEKQAVLMQWQLRLQKDGIVSVTTPEDGDSVMDGSCTSAWTLEADSSGLVNEGESHGHNQQPKEPPDDRNIHRFAGDGRQAEKANRAEWNALEGRWKKFSESPFPQLPVDHEVWHNAVQAHPNVLMEWLQQVNSPEFVLRTLKVNIILDWTRQYRIDCLVIGMSEVLEAAMNRQMNGDPVDEVAVKAIQHWLDFICNERNTMRDDSYIHSKDLWSALNKLDPGKVQLVQLCRKRKADQLSRQLIASFAYATEISSMLGYPGLISFDTREAFNRFLQLLQDNSRVRKVFFGNDSEGDWAALESLLAIKHENAVPENGEAMED